MKRLAGGLGVLAPPAAAVAVLLAGRLTPGYDPLARTISRLAEPRLQTAFLVELAIAVVGFALVALAIALGPWSRAGRVLLAAAGAGLLVAPPTPPHPTSASPTAPPRPA